GPRVRTGRPVVRASGIGVTRRIPRPRSPREWHCLYLSLLERDVAGHGDELPILRRLEVGGLDTRVIRWAVAQTWHERARDVLHLVEVRHEALAGQIFARALQRLDEYLTVCVSGLGEAADLFLRRVLRH